MSNPSAQNKMTPSGSGREESGSVTLSYQDLAAYRFYTTTCEFNKIKPVKFAEWLRTLYNVDVVPCANPLMEKLLDRLK